MNQVGEPDMTEARYTEDDLAKAWDEGRKHGATWPFGKRGLGTDDNPYRSS